MQDAGLRWYVQLITAKEGSEYWLGVVATAGLLPVALFSILAGNIADRFPKRGILISAQVLAMVTAFAFSIWVGGWGVPFPFVIAFAIFGGSLRAFEIPARQAFVVEMVGRSDLISAIALNSAVFNAGRVLGPMGAGIAIHLFGVAGCFFVNGVSFLAIIYALAVMEVPFPAAPKKHGAWSAEFFEGFRTIVASPVLTRLFVGLFLVQVTAGTFQTLLPALTDKHLEMGSSGYSILLTAAGMGALLGSLVVGNVKTLSARQPLIILGVILQGTGLILLSMWQQVIFSVVCLFGIGIGWILFLASTNSTIQLSVDDSVRGRVMSFWVMVFGLSLPLGSYISGSVAHAIGIPNAFFGQGVACLATLLLIGRAPLPDAVGSVGAGDDSGGGRSSLS